MKQIHSKLGLRTLALAAVTLAAWPSPAAGQEQSTVKNPGDHPAYPVEIEPHLAVGLASRFDGVGVGGRFSIPVLRNGFIPSINNNVAVGFGVDWAHRDGCFGYADCRSADAFWFPGVMQWNFFLSEHWSTFVEPGLAVGYTTYSDVCAMRDVVGNIVYTGCGTSSAYLDPAFFVGGRYRATDRFALTMRVGYPYLAIGGSFM